HERAYLYLDNPPAFTYGDLKFIIHALKVAGMKVTGKPIRVGATFDPGPEFAKSEFKYKKHPEILGGSAMGHKTFVDCYSVLKGDKDSYAGFPNGIPDQTPFGTFFGRQSQHFLSDPARDSRRFRYGFAFGAPGRSTTGSTFDGKESKQPKRESSTQTVTDFWKPSPKECTNTQIPTRGSTLTVSGALGRDALNLK